MKETLVKLITLLKEEHKKQSKQFNNKINLKKTSVYKIKEEYDVLNNLYLYLNHLSNGLVPEMHVKIDELNLDYFVDLRVKARNSVNDKIERYIKKDNKGGFPIIKCFNDLMGFRIVFEEDITYDEINCIINEIDPEIKCINASKNEYVATHVYIEKSNFDFPWELQIWDKKHQQSNLDSHEKYKQSYVAIEKDYKGGEDNGNTLHIN